MKKFLTNNLLLFFSIFHIIFTIFFSIMIYSEVGLFTYLLLIFIMLSRLIKWFDKHYKNKED
jgi:hypothetical protein